MIVKEEFSKYFLFLLNDSGNWNAELNIKLCMIGQFLRSTYKDTIALLKLLVNLYLIWDDESIGKLTLTIIHFNLLN